MNRKTFGRGVGVLLLGGVLAVAACDTDVTNPGPVQDQFLERAEAHEALVNGMGRAAAHALNWLSYTGAAVSREIHPAGSTGSFGITPRWQRGELSATDDDLDTHWEQAQRARWLAENGIERMKANPETDQKLLAQAYLWAGYANRILGEHMCQSVIDGGAPGAHTVFLDRAEAAFGQAATLGTGNVKTAAIAGRASVRVSLGKWSDAVADAAQVPNGFVYQMPYFNVGDDALRNRIQWAMGGAPYRAHTVWNTQWEQYFKSTNDPRTRWQDSGRNGDAAIDCCGNVPFYPSLKYTNPADDMDLSSSQEMRLIEAEHMLRNGDMAGAMAKINALRTAAGAPAVTAATMADAWTILKRERGIELWLEGRRFGDLRRWAADSADGGSLHPLETPSGSASQGSHLVQQDLCFPIPPSEQQTNPNVPTAS